MTTDELDKIEQAIQTQDGMAAVVAAFAEYPRLIAIARAALALEDSDDFHIQSQHQSIKGYECAYCGAKTPMHVLRANQVHAPDCPYANLGKALEG